MCIRDRDNICYGRYEASRGSTLTAYLPGKVYQARNLEPRIPEESLVTKLAFHYEGGIARARLSGQVKTIQAMAALLEGYEHEGYYRRSRQGNDRYNDPVNQANNNNSRGNYRPNFNNRNDNNDNRGQFFPITTTIIQTTITTDQAAPITSITG